MMHFRTRKDVDSRYVMWQLNSKSVYSQALLDVFGATAPHVNVETIANYALVEPPFAEQEAIADFIEQQTSKTDRLAGRISDSVDLLRERRTALISAVVTGKIDVRKL